MTNRVLLAFVIAFLLLISYEAEGWRRRRRRRGNPPVDCTVSSWSSWGRCSHQCGLGGTQTRSRIKTKPEQFGGTCDKQLSEVRSCNPAPGCPNGGIPVQGGRCLCRPGWTGQCCDIEDNVDGNWSQWGSWTPCTRTCGQGHRTRERKCDNPPPRGSLGRDCPGNDQDRDICTIISDCSRAGKTGQKPALN